MRSRFCCPGSREATRHGLGLNFGAQFLGPPSIGNRLRIVVSILWANKGAGGPPYVFCRRGHPSAQRPDLFRRQLFYQSTLRRFVIGPFLGPGRLPNHGGRRFRPLAETDLDDSTWIRRALPISRVGPLFHGIRLSFGGRAHDGTQRLAWLFAG
jgi:hypothetical protein